MRKRGLIVAGLVALTGVLWWNQPKKLYPEKIIDLAWIDQGAPFTPTGLAKGHHSWWIGNDGRNAEGDPNRASIVEVSEEFSRVLQNVHYTEFSASIGSIQGVALDGDNLWVAGLGLRRLWRWREGRVDTIPLSYVPNALAAFEGRLFVGKSGSSSAPNYIDVMTADGKVERSIDVGTHPDHLFVSASGIWITAGSNGSAGTLLLESETGRVLRRFILQGADAIEGVVVIGNTAWIVNDGRFHKGEPPLNRILVYKLPE